MLKANDEAMSRQAQRGAITLISVVVMSTLTMALAGALFVLLLAGHQAIGQRLEREIAFRAAELALIDGERNLRDITKVMADAAASAASAQPDHRFATWPAPGRCGTQAQRGLCSAAVGQPPPWRAWMGVGLPADDIGIPIGTESGATLPVIPAEMAGATTVPRYLIERLPQKDTGASDTGASAPAGVPARRYRITALGQGRDPAARVVLQTEWIDPSPRDGAAGQPGRAGIRRLGWRELVPPYPP
ncbi:pilus assembly protein [Cupriavidus sp. UGS-1]|uniref:pilus assembly protein n=1 Tax=Cupriavidus sp. UGS-1 TaxID=2899826 RepID=UPI001E362412|nr:pilus assembly protein [Cupriavidus sp. UGS-1]MCD9120152.1 pilus assembly protein [Cupriavidus sp. UGS-1]